MESFSTPHKEFFYLKTSKQLDVVNMHFEVNFLEETKP